MNEGDVLICVDPKDEYYLQVGCVNLISNGGDWLSKKKYHEFYGKDAYNMDTYITICKENDRISITSQEEDGDPIIFPVKETKELINLLKSLIKG